MTNAGETTAGELRSGKGHKDENFPVASKIIHLRHRALILASIISCGLRMMSRITHC